MERKNEHILRSLDKVLSPLYLEVEASVAESVHVHVAEWHRQEILKVLDDLELFHTSITGDVGNALRRKVSEIREQYEEES